MTLDDILKLKAVKVISCPCGTKITLTCTVFADERAIHGVGTNLHTDAPLDHFGYTACPKCYKPYSVKRFSNSFHHRVNKLASELSK